MVMLRRKVPIVPYTKPVAVSDALRDAAKNRAAKTGQQIAQLVGLLWAQALHHLTLSADSAPGDFDFIPKRLAFVRLNVRFCSMARSRFTILPMDRAMAVAVAAPVRRARSCIPSRQGQRISMWTG